MSTSEGGPTAPARATDPGIDLGRLVACYMVVQLHVSGYDFHQLGPRWWAANVYDSAVRACVPLFIMLSGATLLRKEEPLTLFFRKRVVRIVPALFFWSFVYLSRGPVPYRQWIQATLSGPVCYHLWYLHATLGLYLFIPFLRKIYLHSSRREKQLYLALWATISCLWPALQLLLHPSFDLVAVYYLQPFVGYVGYFFLGAYLYESLAGRASLRAGDVALYLLATAGTVLGTGALSRRDGHGNEELFYYFAPLVMLAAVGLFGVLLALGRRLSGPSLPLLRRLAEGTLGIYCLHPIVIDARLGRLSPLVPLLTSGWSAIALTSLSVFSGCAVVITLMRLVKPLRWVT
jgi:surface polysaccharide O-acyltransferase-like enzyme